MEIDDAKTTETLRKLISASEAKGIAIDQLTPDQREALLQWGMRMYGLGQQIVGDIQDIKYEGRLIILDDDSRWAVESIDATTAEFWNTFDKVLVIDDIMYRLEDAEQISVERET